MEEEKRAVKQRETAILGKMERKRDKRWRERWRRDRDRCKRNYAGN